MSSRRFITPLALMVMLGASSNALAATGHVREKAIRDKQARETVARERIIFQEGAVARYEQAIKNKEIRFKVKEIDSPPESYTPKRKARFEERQLVRQARREARLARSLNAPNAHITRSRARIALRTEELLQLEKEVASLTA
jgi:hypothetical protein